MHNIKVGDRLEIKFMREGEAPKIYLSQVYDFVSDGAIIVHTPISYGKYVPMSRSQACSLLFFLEEGMLSFEAVVIEMLKDQDFNLVKLKFTSEGVRMQRREFYRFECTLPLRFSVIQDNPDILRDSDPVVQSPPSLEGIIKDIGGGGVRFVSNVEVEGGSQLKCLLLVDREYIVVVGKVLHKFSFPRSPYKFQYRVIFVGILPDEKEKIVQYVFNQQRKLLSRQRRGITASD